MSNKGPVARLIETPVIGVVGVIADAFAVIVVLNNENLMDWAQRHIRWIVILAAALLAGLIGLINTVARLRGARRHDAEHMAELASAPQVTDRRRFAEFIEVFGLRTPLYIWLKNGYLVSGATRQQLQLLDSVGNKWELDPTNYRDAELCAAFSELRDSVADMRDATVEYWSDNRTVANDSTVFRVPIEWEFGNQSRWDEAIHALERVHEQVMDS